ncbi:hypothetical protein [Microcoleus sp. Pol12B4]|uniref:hypothetical protein n=1 Tax=Microcoleus sp. Pol12B4 TaxID=3055395 RepID=UPI002FD14E8D
MDVLGDFNGVKVGKNIFQLCYENKLQSWACQWTFANFIQNGMNILANVNLASNIGHGVGGTNTEDVNSPYSNMRVEAITFPTKHLPFAIRDTQADNFTQKNIGIPSAVVKKVQKK